MNDIFKDKLKLLNEDKLALEAVYQACKERIEQEYPHLNDFDDDTVLGQKYRSYCKAKDLLFECFKYLESFKDYRDKNNNFNKAK